MHFQTFLVKVIQTILETVNFNTLSILLRKYHHCINLHKTNWKTFSFPTAQQARLLQLLSCYFCITSLKTIASHCREGCWAVGWKTWMLCLRTCFKSAMDLAYLHRVREGCWLTGCLLPLIKICLLRDRMLMKRRDLFLEISPLLPLNEINVSWMAHLETQKAKAS